MTDGDGERLAWLLERFKDVQITHEPTDVVVLRQENKAVVVMLDALHAMTPQEWLKFQQFIQQEILCDDNADV